MLTDHQIRELLTGAKSIVAKTPAQGYREEKGYREESSNRCDLELESVSDSEAKFSVFIRQSVRFVENFSIGLQYLTNDGRLGRITLVRYNGPHGESSRDADGHYAKPHIHRITEAELTSGSSQPQESQREITERYDTFQDALRVFFGDTAISNYGDYFPELHQWRPFDEHQ